MERMIKPVDVKMFQKVMLSSFRKKWMNCVLITLLEGENKTYEVKLKINRLKV